MGRKRRYKGSSASMREPLRASLDHLWLCDGAMGTQLIEAGLEVGHSGSAWNLTQPEKVRAIQAAYVEAGAEILLTNSFQGCPLTLARHGLQDRAYEINLAAARIARDCIGGHGYVLGDIGPFGGFLAPLGNTSRGDLVDAFALQTTALLDGGVDGIIIETMTALDEMEAAIEAVRSCRKDVTIVGSITFDRVADGGFKTMTGITVREAVETLVQWNVPIIGCNCGTGLHVGDYVQLTAEMRALTDRPLMVQPNAGQPRLARDRIVYDESPQMMAASIPSLVEAGASIIGGCCGTGPEHIRLFRERLDPMRRRT